MGLSPLLVLGLRPRLEFSFGSNSGQGLLTRNINDPESIGDLNSNNIQTYYKTIELSYDKFFDSLKFLFDINLINKNNQQIINNFINQYKKFLNILNKNPKDKIINLLRNINLYSFGFIFVEWVSKNHNKLICYKNFDISIYLRKIVDIIGVCCSNVLIIDNKIYFSNNNFDSVDFNFL